MKILLLHNRWAFPPADGGMVAMSSMAEGLAASGHEVSVFALNPSRNYIKPEELQVPDYIRHYHLEYIKTDITLWGAMVNLVQNKSYHASRFYQSNVAQSLTKFILQHGFDLVVADSIYLAPYKSATSLPFIVRVHNVEHEIWKGVANETTSVLKKIYLTITIRQLDFFEKQAASLADGMIFLSGEDASWFQQHCMLPPYIVSPTAFNLKTAASYRSSVGDSQTLVHIASMDWMPNVQALDWFLEQVWPLVKLTAPLAKLKLAGKKMPEKYRLLNDPDIQVLGFVDDVYSFMASGSIMIVPLFSGSGIRIKIIEGMVMGKAMVVTSKAIQGLELLPGHDVLVADEPDDFARAVSLLLHDELWRNRLGQAAAQTAETRFDLAKTSRDLSEFLGRFLG